jgi:hypothetical protein
MTPTLLRFADLKARGVVSNWVTLARWIEREGFPPGKRLGPNTRAWRDDEIEAWLETRPAAAVNGTAEAK